MAVTNGETGSLAALPRAAAIVPFALFAQRGGAEPPALPPGYALDAGEKAVAGPGYSKRALYIAIALSAVLHLVLFGYFAARNGTALSPPDVRELGAEEGRPENLSVSVITEADLKSLRTVPLPQDQAVAQPAPKEPPSPEQEQREAATPPQKSPFQAPEDPSGFAARFADQFTASMKQAFAEAEKRKVSRPPVRVSPNLSFFRPAATHSGKSDEFERAVAWALAATVPQGNGVWGSTIVTFVVSANGQVQDLRLLKSSGDKFLDTGALMAVRQARLPTPPADLGAGDRTFNVEYISR
jgi:periplasmic protein TonB